VNRRDFITLLGGAAAAWPLAARAQQGERMRRIGVLMGPAESDPEAQSEITAFRRALQDLGWTGDRNVRIAYRWSAGDTDRMRTSAKELVALQPDVIFATNTPVVAALLRETRTVPIVFVRVSDPVGDGFVSNLARPSGNVTGFAFFEPSLLTKWLGLLKEIAPGTVRVTAMFNPTTSPGGGSHFLRLAQAAASSIAIELNASPVNDVAGIERTIAAVAREPNGGCAVC
jgi:putative tryptophan/tyrosine transport system substrate-binding protein